MQVSLKEIRKVFEEFAPLPLQESYDNAGLIVGDEDGSATGALITLESTLRSTKSSLSPKMRSTPNRK